MSTIHEEAPGILERYLDWYANNFFDIHTSGSGVISFVTPFVDDSNDLITVFMSKVGGKYKLSDAGAVCNYFKDIFKDRGMIAGAMALGEYLRQDRIQAYMNANKIQYAKGEFFAMASKANFPWRLNGFIQFLVMALNT